MNMKTIEDINSSAMKTTNYLGFTLTVLSWTNYAYSDSDSILKKFYNIILLLSYILSVTYNASLLLNILNTTDNIKSWTDAVVVFSGMLCAWCNLITVSLKRGEIKKLVVTLNTKFSEIESSFRIPDNLSIQKTERVNRIFVKCFVLGSVFIANFYGMSPVVEMILSYGNMTGGPTKPGGAATSRLWIPFGDVSSIEYGVVFYFYEYINLVFISVHMYSGSSFTMSLANHMIVRFKVLQYQLRNMSIIVMSNHREKCQLVNCTGRLTSKKDSAIFYRGCERKLQEDMSTYLSKCVKYHEEILSLCIQSLNIISPILFGIVGINLLGMCMLSFQASVAPVNSVTFLISIYTGILISSNTVFVCWFFSEVTKQSSIVAEAAYECGWEDCPKSYRTSAMLMITKANKKLKIAAGGIAVIDMENFVNMLQLTFSYYTFLRRLNIREE